MFEALKALDRSLLLEINSHHHPGIDQVMWFFSLTWPTVFIALSVAFYFYFKFSPRKALEFLLGCAIVFACADLSSNSIKHSVKRYRPTHNLEISQHIHTVNDYRGGKYSFVSGHASNTFGIMTFIFLCLRMFPLSRRLLLFLFPLLVVYSRMYLGVHYPSDIITGTILGLIFGSLVFYIMNKYFLKLDAGAV
jgi:undecaprenyl-diphosphatase